jgi:hypothetical protein
VLLAASFRSRACFLAAAQFLCRMLARLIRKNTPAVVRGVRRGSLLHQSTSCFRTPPVFLPRYHTYVFIESVKIKIKPKLIALPKNVISCSLQTHFPKPHLLKVRINQTKIEVINPPCMPFSFSTRDSTFALSSSVFSPLESELTLKFKSSWRVAEILGAGTLFLIWLNTIIS